MADFKKVPGTDQTVGLFTERLEVLGFSLTTFDILLTVLVLAVGLMLYGMIPRKPKRRDFEKYAPDSYRPGRRG